MLPIHTLQTAELLRLRNFTNNVILVKVKVFWEGHTTYLILSLYFPGMFVMIKPDSKLESKVRRLQLHNYLIVSHEISGTVLDHILLEGKTVPQFLKNSSWVIFVHPSFHMCLRIIHRKTSSFTISAGDLLSKYTINS